MRTNAGGRGLEISRRGFGRPLGPRRVGAIATQSYANTSYGPTGLDLLARGETPEGVIRTLTASDAQAAKRQVGSSTCAAAPRPSAAANAFPGSAA